MDIADERWAGLTLNDGRTAHHTERILDTRQGDLTWLVGTVYLDMHLKPNILEDIKADLSLTAAAPQGSWRDPQQDTISLEDESGRIRLIGSKLNSETLCTGIVIAVLGSETSSGDFEVIDVSYPGLAPTTEGPREDSCDDSDDAEICFVSGINIEGSDHDGLHLGLLGEYLSGELEPEAARIKSLVVIGSSVHGTPVPREDAMARRAGSGRKYGYDASTYNARPMAALDDLLSEVAQNLEVIVVPGDRDPTNVTLPQQSMHAIMFPQAAQLIDSSLFLTTNPTWLSLGGRRMFATAGQAIDDISHYVVTSPGEGEDGKGLHECSRLDLLEATLRWRHAAPTAPDTLWTYPFSDDDPFIFSLKPDIYACGGGARFEHRRLDPTTLLLSLPDFKETRQIVRVNVRTLECQIVELRQLA